MAVTESRDNRTFIAGESLTAAQFLFVTLESDGQIDLADGAGEQCIGVLENDPATGGEATVTVSGKCRVKAGGTIAAVEVKPIREKFLKITKKPTQTNSQKTEESAE